ncbi:hypothetical protein [Kineococcus sp. G2]|uniref:hypothetical protein n=1 Tax=Kineococcus sp. G2 TaxID=3127484 RepID=UPI00301BB817
MSFQTLEAVATQQTVVRVDLLPPEIGQQRAFRRLQLALAGGVAVVAGMAGAAAIITLGHVSTAQEALDAEQAKTPALQRTQQQYAEVPQVLGELAQVQSARDTAKAYEVPLYAYLDRIATGAPSDLSLSSLTIAVTAGSGSSSGTVDGTTPVVADGIGTVNVTGSTKSQDKVAAWMESLEAIDGLDATALSSSQRDEQGTVTFTTSSTLTSAALAHGS